MALKLRRNITRSGNAAKEVGEVTSRPNESQPKEQHQESQKKLDEHAMADVIDVFHALGKAKRNCSVKNYVQRKKTSQEESITVTKKDSKK